MKVLFFVKNVPSIMNTILQLSFLPVEVSRKVFVVCFVTQSYQTVIPSIIFNKICSTVKKLHLINLNG